MKNNEKFSKIWMKIVERSWEDDAFKQQLIKNPQKVCEEYGIPIPLNTEYKVIEEKDPHKHIVYISLPIKPDGELSEEELKEVSAGCFCW